MTKGYLDYAWAVTPYLSLVWAVVISAFGGPGPGALWALITTVMYMVWGVDTLFNFLCLTTVVVGFFSFAFDDVSCNRRP